jgi:hypothetical protein
MCGVIPAVAAVGCTGGAVLVVWNPPKTLASAGRAMWRRGAEAAMALAGAIVAAARLWNGVPPRGWITCGPGLRYGTFIAWV